MRFRDRSKLVIFAGAAWFVLAGLVAAYRVSATVTAQAVSAAAVAALGLAVVAAGRNAASVWRGPALRPFPHDDAVCCSPSQAAVVRAAAQLRGTLGGAGHVHPRRLALPAFGWLAAAAFALEAVFDPMDPAMLLWAGGALALWSAAAMLPARPFFYREAVGGRLVIHPRCAWDDLVRCRPQLPCEPAIAAGAVVEQQSPPASVEGWGTSLIVAPSGGKDAEPRVDPAS